MAARTVDEPYCPTCGESVPNPTNGRCAQGHLVLTREGRPVQTMNHAAPVTVLAESKSWDQVALERIRELVGQIVEMQDKRVEAESICKGLTAAGFDAPPLPWKKVASQTATPAVRTYRKTNPMPACSRCGVQQTNHAHYRRIDGEAVCLQCQPATAAVS